MSENTRLDIDSNIPQQMDNIGKAVDRTAKKIENLGSSSAFEELQRTMKLVGREFKAFGGTVDDAFAKALENVSRADLPAGIRDVYRKALRDAKEGQKQLNNELGRFSEPYEKAAKQVEAAQAKLAKAVRQKKSQSEAKVELNAALDTKRNLEDQISAVLENGKILENFHRSLRDALNREYNEFYLKRQATQQTASLAELQMFKDLGVRLQGEDLALYKKLSDAAKANDAEELARYRQKLQQMDAAQKGADSRMLAMRKDSLARGKSLILQAAKDDLAAQASADKDSASAELARYRQKLQQMDAAQKDADSRMLAMRKDSLARGKSLILQAAKDDLAAQASADKDTASAELARYRQKLQQMDAAQRGADSRMLAMRKDSLARGKSLILQAAKDDLAAQASVDKSAASAELARYRQKLQQMDAAQRDADSRMLAMRKDSLARGKSLILQAAKDDLAAQASVDKSAASAELARYRQKLQQMDAAQKDADSRMLAMRKDSLARGKTLIIQAANEELKSSSLFAKASSEAAAKDQEFITRYQRATAQLAKGQTARAQSLIDTLSKIKAAAGTTAEMEAAAITKYGKAYVAAAQGSVVSELDKQLKATIAKYTADNSTYKAIRAQVSAATSGAAGLYSDIGSRQLQVPSLDSLNKSLATTGTKLSPLLQGFKTLGGRIIDVHSATRGLASGFNLLWLTWGQMGPLFAGAAISMGTKSIVSMGAQIGHQLEIIKVLSEESESAVQSLNEQLMKIAKTGPYGPMQVAEAMKTLSLAGLTATEVTSALPRVLQFAAAGTTTIEKAAEVMTGVATAFGYTADSFNIVGDVITKTAAVSKAGIEDMGEAFKAASVVSTQFGVSIKDVSLLLALQANLNIKNSQAGTNVRNMYTDLSGRTKESRKLMKELNLELTDSQGRFKDVVTIVKDLDKALSKFTGKGARDAQLQLISERGGKPIVAALTAYKTEVREFSVVNGQMVETVTNQLEQLKKKTEDNYGFMALAAAKLSMTPLKQMESVLATFQTSIATAFRGMEDEVIVTSARLKEVFNSPEFAAALKNLITGVAALTEALLENLDVAGKVILGYVGFKVLATVAGMFLTLHKNVQAATGSLVAYRAAQATAAGADTAAASAAAASAAATARVGSNLLRAIPVIGTVVSLGTAAWSMWELYNATQSETANVTKSAADALKKSGLIEALDAENEALLKQVAILDLSLKLKRKVTDQEFEAMKAAEDSAAAEAKRTNEAIAQVRELEKKEASIRQAAANLTASLYKTMGEDAKNSLPVKQLNKQADEIAAARAKINTVTQLTELEIKVGRNSATAKVVSDMTEELAKTLREAKIPGTKIFDPDAADKSAKSVVSSIEKQISAVVKGGNARLSELKSNYDLARDILDAEHKAGIVSEGAYQAQLVKQTVLGEAEQLKAIEDTRKLIEPLYAEALSKYKAGTEEYAALDEKRNAEFEALEAKRVEIANAANKRQRLAYVEHQSSLIKLQKEIDKYFNDLSIERNKEAALTKLNKQYENVNDSSVIWLQAEKAGAMASAEAFAKHEGKLRDMEKAYEDVAKAEEDMQAAIAYTSSVGLDIPELKDALYRLGEQRLAMEKSNANSRVKIEQDIAEKGAIAYQEAYRKRANEFKNTVAQTLADALISGANDGGKSLRKILENELKAPFVLLFRMSIDALLGDLGSAVGGGTGGGTGSGGVSSVMSTLSTASTLNTAYKALSGAIEGSIGKSFEKFALSDIGSSLGLSAAKTFELSSASQEAFTAMQNANGIAGEFGSTLTSTTKEVTSLGKTFTDVGTGIAAAFAGQALRKGISGGYSVGGAGETVMDIAAIAASFMGPVASIITGAVSGLVNRAFGRKLKDTGIQGTFAGSEFKGESYQYLKGGWFRSNKTKTSALDQETTNTFTNTFRSIQASTAVLATNMGLSAKAALDFQKEIKISLKDLDPAAQNEAITKMFTDLQEEMATAVLDAWGDWSLIAKYGETASEVLTNVSNNLTGFNGMLELLDLKLISLTMNGAATASEIVEAAGGVDQLTSIYGSYYENFYSEAERNNKSIETLTDKFSSLGVVMPALTRDAEGFVTNGQEARDTFRQIVTAVANAGNIKLATELVQLSEEFANVAKVVEKTTEVLDGLKQTTKQLEAEFLKAQGDLDGYAAAIRAIETVDMSAVEVATYDYNKTLEKYIELLGQAEEAKATATEAEIRLLKAQGKELVAASKQRELDIKGMSEAQVAAYDYAAAIDRQIEAMEKLSASRDSITNSEIKLLRAQGNETAALAKQRELDIRNMTKAEIAAYDYSAAIDQQVDKLNKAADIVSKLGDVSSDLASYLRGFEADSTNSFYKTIGEALSGDLDAMGRVTSEADKAIESARSSARSTSEFALKRAEVIAKVGQVKAFADTLSKETDAEKIIKAIKGETTTSDEVKSLGTRLSSQDIAVSLNATLESIKKTAGANTDIAGIQNLFTKLTATVSSMSMAKQATDSGQAILKMFDSMRATVLDVTMSAPKSEVDKVTSAFSSITAFVNKIVASGLNEASAQTAVGSAANITAAINKLVSYGLTTTSAQTALASLANITSYIAAIDVKPGNTLSKQFESELAAYSSISANISAIAVSANIVENRKLAITNTLSTIAANISAISTSNGVAESKKASLNTTFSNVAAVISSINTASNIESKFVEALTDSLDSFQAKVSTIAVTAPDSNIKDLLLGNSDEISYGLALAAAIEAGAGNFGLSEAEAKSLLLGANTIKKTLSVAAGVDGPLTAAQKEAYTNTRTEITKALAVKAGTDGALTEAQKTVLANASTSLTKALAVKAGTDGTLTEAQKTVLANASTSLTKLLSVASGKDAVLTAAQQSVLSGVSASVVKTLAVKAGTDGTLTTAQQQAYANASTTISKAVSVVKGTDASNLTEAQKVLLGILGGSSDGKVTVGGAVDYKPSDELDNLMTNLADALGRVGIEKMTAELGRLTAAINRQIAATDAEKKLADAQRAGADIAARIAAKSTEIRSDLDTIAKIGPKYGFNVNRNLGDNPWLYVANITVQPDFTALQYGSAVTADLSKANMTAFAKALLAANVGNSTVAKQDELDAALLELEAARSAVRALGGVPQFATGGYTGSGGVNELAGMVHKGEIVWSQSDIANAGGVDVVEAMRSGFMPYAKDIPAPDVTYNTTQSTINLDNSALLEELQALREEVSNLRYEARATAINTGKAAKHLKEFDDRGMKVKNSDTEALKTTVV